MFGLPGQDAPQVEGLQFSLGGLSTRNESTIGGSSSPSQIGKGGCIEAKWEKVGGSTALQLIVP